MIMRRNQWHGQPTSQRNECEFNFADKCIIQRSPSAWHVVATNKPNIRVCCLYLNPLHSSDSNQTGFIRQRRSRQFCCTIKTNELYTLARCRLAASVAAFFVFGWPAFDNTFYPFLLGASHSTGAFHLPIFVSLVFFIISFNISFLFPATNDSVAPWRLFGIYSFYANSFDSFISLPSLDAHHVCVLCVCVTSHACMCCWSRLQKIECRLDMTMCLSTVRFIVTTFLCLSDEIIMLMIVNLNLFMFLVSFSVHVSVSQLCRRVNIFFVLLFCFSASLSFHLYPDKCTPCWCAMCVLVLLCI